MCPVVTQVSAAAAKQGQKRTSWSPLQYRYSTCVGCMCDLWVKADTSIGTTTLRELGDVLQQNSLMQRSGQRPQQWCWHFCADTRNANAQSHEVKATQFEPPTSLRQCDMVIWPTLSYVPESCQATLTKMGLQWRPLMSSRTSSLASLMASFFVVLLTV